VGRFVALLARRRRDASQGEAPHDVAEALHERWVVEPFDPQRHAPFGSVPYEEPRGPSAPEHVAQLGPQARRQAARLPAELAPLRSHAKELPLLSHEPPDRDERDRE
jgi:hypothetical protein